MEKIDTGMGMLLVSVGVELCLCALRGCVAAKLCGRRGCGTDSDAVSLFVTWKQQKAMATFKSRDLRNEASTKMKREEIE